MANDANQFGQSINLGNSSDPTTGNGMIKKYLGHKAKYKQQLETMTSNDIHAKRYFCGDDVIYVFPRAAVEALYKALNNGSTHDNDSIVLLQGCKADEWDSRKPIGRPTLIALPYKYDAGTQYLNRVQMLDGIDGREHPGGLRASKGIFIPNQNNQDQEQVADEIYWPDLGVLTETLTK